MTTLETTIPTYPNAEYGTGGGKVYSYDLKMEIGVEEGMSTVPVPVIFKDLIKTLTDAAGHSLVILDTKDHPYKDTEVLTSAQYEAAFCVETTEGRNRKVAMGFKMKTTTPISTLKSRTMEYLSARHIYLRIHKGGFLNGIKASFVAFYTQEHHKTADTDELKERLLIAIREFLAYIGGQILVSQPYLPILERTGDIGLMDHAIHMECFSPEDLAIINYCRLYLHITTMSELFDASGTNIMTHMLHCERPAWFDPTVITTLQRRPSTYQINRPWRRLCREWSYDDGRAAPDVQLGPWTITTPRLRRETYYTKSVWPIIYHWRDDAYWEYHPNAYDPTLFIPIHSTPWSPDSDSRPLTIQINPDDTITATIPDQILHPAPRSYYLEWNEYVLTLGC